MCKRIIAVFCSFVTLFSAFSLPARADGGLVSFDVDAVGIGEWVLDKKTQNVNWLKHLIDTDVCPQSTSMNNHHNFKEQRTTVNGKLGLYYICEYCGKSAGEVMNGSTNEDGTTTPGAYQNYVSTLPSNGYSSDNSLLWYPSWDDLVPTKQTQDNDGVITKKFSFYGLNSSYSSSSVDMPLDGTSVVVRKITYSKGGDNRSISAFYHSDGSCSLTGARSGGYTFHVPISGTYFQMASPAYVIHYSKADGSGIGRVGGSFSAASSGTHLVAKGVCRVTEASESISVSAGYLQGSMYFPIYRVVADILPDEPAPDYTTTYNSTTRMGNIGGYYGTVNNDNSVTQYTTQYIVNESNNIYTNPVTGQSQPILDWSYNYDDRSYTLTLEGGDTTNVTYGDEKVSINETHIDGNGNTVTNKYEVNYITNNGTGSGDGDTDPSPSPSPSTKPGGDGGGSGSGNNPGGSGSGSGSTNPLSRVFKNYAANITQAYGTDGHGGTDCVPTSGAADTVTAHSEGDVVWVQTGQENNQGSEGDISYGNAVKVKHSNGYYTLYAHLATVEVSQGSHVYKGQALGMMGDTGNSYGAHLHFEVRDDADARLNSDPYLNADLPGLEGGGATGEKKHWWEKIGDVIGIGISGLVDIIAIAIDKVMDSLISLLEMLIERLKTVVETILSVLDYLPSLFGGFLDLLGLLFPFLPEEITTLLTFGVIAVVAIWIIKAFLGR